MLGKLFNDQNLRDESGEEGEGKLYRPRFDIDLDSGVVRMPTLPSKAADDTTDETDDSAR
ncbi:hypothetical protein [Pseudonocardia spinosispora]|uniref:hypothetical protein n=1 Tax=Pseudonocardia spinosispora TaxID=103441 RepID=UPI000429E4AA|nr:hypothetical protein [Pseudonocardia spinosispora]